MARNKLDRLTIMAAALLAGLMGCGTSDNVISSNNWEESRATHSEQVKETANAAGAVKLVVRTVNGRIAVRAAEGGIATVEATKKVKAYDREAAERFASDVAVTVERRGDEISISTSYPRPPDDVNVAIDLVIAVPGELSTDLRLVNGWINVENMQKEIFARTTSGGIRVLGGCGSVNLEAGNGIVSADISELRGEGRFATGNGDVAVVIRSGQVPISASTVNGSVSLRLPGNFDGFLDARTANGRVRSDFSVTGAGWVGVNRIRGSIGSGGDPTIKLWSTNGNVWLRKGA